MRSHRLLAVLFFATSVHASSSCVSVDKQKSAAWLDRDRVTKRFSIRFHIKNWEAFMRITLRWPDAVKIEHVYEAKQLAQPGDYGGGRVSEVSHAVTPLLNPHLLRYHLSHR